MTWPQVLSQRPGPGLLCLHAGSFAAQHHKCQAQAGGRPRVESSFLSFLLTPTMFSERNPATIGKEENLVPHTVLSQLIGTGLEGRLRPEQTESPGESNSCWVCNFP